MSGITENHKTVKGKFGVQVELAPDVKIVLSHSLGSEYILEIKHPSNVSVKNKAQIYLDYRRSELLNLLDFNSIAKMARDLSGEDDKIKLNSMKVQKLIEDYEKELSEYYKDKESVSVEINQTDLTITDYTITVDFDFGMEMYITVIILDEEDLDPYDYDFDLIINHYPQHFRKEVRYADLQKN